MTDQKKNQKLKHNFDGIEEYNNTPPKWWLLLFVVTTIAGIIYFLHFTVIGTGESQITEYQREVNPDYVNRQMISEASFVSMIHQEYGHEPPYRQKLEAPTPLEESQIEQQLDNPFRAQILSAMYNASDEDRQKLREDFPEIFDLYSRGFLPPGDGMVASVKQEDEGSNFLAELASLSPTTDPGNLETGSQIFTKECVACHGQYGEGGIGPNMTDNYWIHGNTYQDVVKTVTKGVPAKGMIAWENQLTKEEILFVSSYIMTLQGTNPPNAKAPQGDLYEQQ